MDETNKTDDVRGEISKVDSQLYEKIQQENDRKDQIMAEIANDSWFDMNQWYDMKKKKGLTEGQRKQESPE